jgi:hypothetical protein
MEKLRPVRYIKGDVNGITGSNGVKPCYTERKPNHRSDLLFGV